MATYKQIQEYIKKEFGFLCKSCWIAHMKEFCGLSVKISPRKISSNIRQVPCPENKKEAIRAAFRYFHMI